MKRCPTCETEKPVTEFGKNRSRHDGLTAACRDCEVERKRKQREDNRARTMFVNYRSRSKNKGLDFDLEQYDFEVLQFAECEYCGTKENLTFDRVDSDEGYVRHNVTACCESCNRMKSDLSRDEFISHITRIAEHNSYPSFL